MHEQCAQRNSTKPSGFSSLLYLNLVETQNYANDQQRTDLFSVLFISSLFFVFSLFVYDLRVSAYSVLWECVVYAAINMTEIQSKILTSVNYQIVCGAWVYQISSQTQHFRRQRKSCVSTQHVNTEQVWVEWQICYAIFRVIQFCTTSDSPTEAATLYFLFESWQHPAEQLRLLIISVL